MAKERKTFNIDSKIWKMLQELSKKDNRSMSNYLEEIIKKEYNKINLQIPK